MADVAAFQILGPRKRQEDAALHVRLGHGRLLVVADGMGGEPAGDVASMSAVLGFESAFGVPPEEPEDNMRWATRFMDGLRGALDAMAEAVERGDGRRGMATTLAAVWADPDGIRWLSVGDSGIWEADSWEDRPPRRLNARHGKGHQVDAALMARSGPFHAKSIEADFCVAEIDLHPAARFVSSGRLIIVGSDGMDVLEDIETAGGWMERAPKPEWLGGSEEYTRLSAEWKQAFRNMNPRDFLDRVEAVLTIGVAQDNTTAIVLRPSVTYSDRAEEYVPVSGAPEREVLGGTPSPQRAT